MFEVRKTRNLPLHPSTLHALERYLLDRPARSTTLVFTTEDGRKLPHNGEPARTFRRLLADVGVVVAGGRRPPRLHDYADLFVMPISA